MQNQLTGEVISTENTSHKYNNKDPSHLQSLSPGIHVSTRYINSNRGTSSTSSEDAPLPVVEFMYFVFTGLCMPCENTRVRILM